MKLATLFGIAIAVAVLISFSYYFGFFSGPENFFEDILFSPKPINPDIIILAIDSESINRIGQWPWPREVFAKALRNLKQSNPKAVGVDVIFSDNSRFGKNDDEKLAAILKEISYPVIFPVEVFSDKTIEPLPDFKPNAELGHVNLILDKDGVARRVPLIIKGEGGKDFTAFSLKIVEKAAIFNFLNLTSKEPRRIVYAAPPNTIRRVPFYSVLSEEFASDSFKNKIVLIGVTSPDLHDEQLTPFSRGTAMPGVEIQANLVNMFLSGYRLESLTGAYSIFWIFLAALISAGSFVLFKRSLKPLLANIAFGVFYIILIIILFEQGIAANFIHINLSWVLSTSSLFAYRYWFGERERRELKNSFSKYVSKEVLDYILEDPARLALGGEKKEITILFSDIRGFTTLSEKTTPQELVHILNRYFTAMTNVVFAHHGVVDKFIGDAIMAFWGAPIADQNQAENAVKAGLGMVGALKNFNKELGAEGKPAIDIGVGIYTGPAVVGNVGSDIRFDYTAIGDSVNVASRLEGLNKTYGTHIIIGESVKAALKENYGFRSLGSVEVKGRKQPLEIYGK